MDTADFILERQDIENRMDARRAETAVEVISTRSGFLPWMMLTGASVVSGFRSSPGARKLVRTLLWAAVAPFVLGVINRQNHGLVHRLFDAVFPAARPKEPAEEVSPPKS